jgi:hypothetical protein
MVNLVKMFTKRVVSVDREICGDDGEARADLHLGFEKISDDTPFVIVPDS